MIFNMYFHSMPMSAKPVSLNGNVLDYIICYPGIEIPCRGEPLEEKDGKIARYHVCYRAENMTISSFQKLKGGYCQKGQ